MALSKKEIKELIDRLLSEIEEEDIGISLFSTFYQNESELDFFTKPDRDRTLVILKRLSDDSKRHKEMLENVITKLGKKIRGK